jgi:hypothetical protein
MVSLTKALFEFGLKVRTVQGRKLDGLLSLHYLEKLPLRAVVGGEALGYNLASNIYIYLNTIFPSH